MAFNPEQFMNSAVDPMATQMEVCPEGEWQMMIDSDPKQLMPEEKSGVSHRTNQPYHFWQMVLTCVVIDDRAKQLLKREKLTVRMQINLDLDEAGNLITGPDKNVKLGQLRAALGQNKPGWSPAQLLGAGPFIGKVKHRITDSGTFADVTSAAKIS